VVAHLSAVNDPASHILTSAPAIDMDLDLDFGSSARNPDT